MSSPLCACLTFAVGLCGQCGDAVCGPHSRVIDGTRMCADDIAARERAAERARADAQQRAEEDAQRRQELVERTIPLPADEAEAFRLTFVHGPRSNRQAKAAHEMLARLSVEHFTATALVVLRSLGTATVTWNTYRGSTRGLYGKARRVASEHTVWKLAEATDRYGDVTTYALSTSGRWFTHSWGGEGWQSYSRTAAWKSDDDLVTALLAARPVLRKHS